LFYNFPQHEFWDICVGHHAPCSTWRYSICADASVCLNTVARGRWYSLLERGRAVWLDRLDAQVVRRNDPEGSNAVVVPVTRGWNPHHDPNGTARPPGERLLAPELPEPYCHGLGCRTRDTARNQFFLSAWGSNAVLHPEGEGRQLNPDRTSVAHGWVAQQVNRHCFGPMQVLYTNGYKKAYSVSGCAFSPHSRQHRRGHLSPQPIPCAGGPVGAGGRTHGCAGLD
jgi:hypothetical protein